MLPIFDRPNKVQKLSLGAIKVIVVPGLSLRRFGSLSGSSTNAVQVLLAEIIGFMCLWHSVLCLWYSGRVVCN